MPKWLPARVFIAYFVGVAHLAAASSYVARRYVRWSTIGLAVMFGLFVLLMDLPAAIARPATSLDWILAARQTTFAIGALALFATETRSQFAAVVANAGDDRQNLDRECSRLLWHSARHPSGAHAGRAQPRAHRSVGPVPAVDRLCDRSPAHRIRHHDVRPEIRERRGRTLRIAHGCCSRSRSTCRSSSLPRTLNSGSRRSTSFSTPCSSPGRCS